METNEGTCCKSSDCNETTDAVKKSACDLNAGVPVQNAGFATPDLPLLIAMNLQLLNHLNRIGDIEKSVGQLIQNMTHFAENSNKGYHEMASRIVKLEERIAQAEKLLVSQGQKNCEKPANGETTSDFDS